MSRPAAAVTASSRRMTCVVWSATRSTSGFVADVGAAFARLVRDEGARQVAIGYDMRASSPSLAAAFAEGVTAQGLDVVADRAGVDRPAVLRVGPARLPRRDVHRQPQPGGLQRHQAVPRRREARRQGHRADRPSARRSSTGVPAYDGAGGHDRRTVTCSPTTATSCARWSNLGRLRPLRVAVDAGNGMGGHTTPAVLGAIDVDHAAAAVSSNSTAPSRTTRPTRWTRPTSSICRRTCSRPAPTSDWPSTATPTAASSSTNQGIRYRRQR